jgi:P-type Ca2+ transporter type 2C
LLGVYALARHSAQTTEVARALVFMVLVLCNLALIHSNRSWERLSWPRAGRSNRYFVWVALAALSLLALALGVPAISALFGFATPPLPLLLTGAGAAVAGLAWFELVKWGMATHARSSRARA